MIVKLANPQSRVGFDGMAADKGLPGTMAKRNKGDGRLCCFRVDSA